MSNNERVKCPKCGSMTLISIDREDLCSNCGKELNYDDLQQRGGKALKLWVLVVFIVAIISIALIMVPFFPHY